MKKIVIFLTVLMVTACKKEAPVIPDEKIVLKVRTDEAKLISFTPRIECFGNLSFTRKTALTSASDGSVEEIFGEVGDRVRRNQVLLKIKNTQLIIQKSQIETRLESSKTAYDLSLTMLEEAKRSMEAKFLSLEKSRLVMKQKEKELELARNNLSKKEELFLIDGISEEEIIGLRLKVESLETGLETMKMDNLIAEIGFRDKDLMDYYGYIPEDPEEKKALLIDLNTIQPQAEVKVAATQVTTSESELEAINILVEELTVRSPYNGILGARSVEVGERVKKGDDLLTTFTDREIHAVFTIQENQRDLVYLGQEVNIHIPSLKQPDHIFKISQISPTIDSQSGNIAVKALANNRSGEFIPGMFFKGEIPLNRTESRLMIPESAAVMTGGDRGYVHLLKGNKAFKRDISFSEDEEDQLWVHKGLKKGDVYILSPPPSLADGMEVILLD